MTQLTIRSMELTEQPISVGKGEQTFGIRTQHLPFLMRLVGQGFDLEHLDPEVRKPACPALVALFKDYREQIERVGSEQVGVGEAASANVVSVVLGAAVDEGDAVESGKLDAHHAVDAVAVSWDTKEDG